MIVSVARLSSSLRVVCSATRLSACTFSASAGASSAPASASGGGGAPSAVVAPIAAAPPVVPVFVRSPDGSRPPSLRAPSAAAAAAILESRRVIFGSTPGSGERSGRKVLRAKLAGPVLKAYYPVDMRELRLERLGLEQPATEERYRRDQELRRIGKTLIKGKARGPDERFLDRMALEDANEDILDQVDYVDAEDVLPGEDALAAMMEGLDEVRTCACRRSSRASDSRCGVRWLVLPCCQLRDNGWRKRSNCPPCAFEWAVQRSFRFCFAAETSRISRFSLPYNP